MLYTEYEFYKYVGDKVRITRQAANMSQNELGDMVGLKRTSITNLEAGQQKIQIYTLCLIAGVLRVPVLTLLPPTDEDEFGADKKKLVSDKKVITGKGEKKELSDSDVENVLKVIR